MLKGPRCAPPVAISVVKFMKLLPDQSDDSDAPEEGSNTSRQYGCWLRGDLNLPRKSLILLRRGSEI